MSRGMETGDTHETHKGIRVKGGREKTEGVRESNMKNRTKH